MSEQTYRPGDRATILFPDGEWRAAEMSPGFFWVSDDKRHRLAAEGGFEVWTPTPQARPSARDVERVLAEVHNTHRWIGGQGCMCGADIAFVPHSAHVAAEQAAALRALPTGDEP